MAVVPMVQLGTVLVVTLINDMDDQAALSMQDDVANRVVDHRCTGVLLDISALDLVDSFISKVLSDTAGIVKILGAAVAVVGMQPAVAITLVELGLSLAGIKTASNLDAGLRSLGYTNAARPR